ncbi:MAG TPA: type II toxin-antitoxin system VapC family toxin [Terracidiphilus sp.]|nr:type II toxin-antitoxin system VapC family toxin [Terracidiphilus sp.]
MILADTSIWIAMFRTGAYSAELHTLIANDQLCTHPFLIAELALGTLPERKKTLAYLDQLISIPPVQLEDIRYMIEARGFASKGIGLTDAHLIASCLAIPGTLLWTLDRKLGNVAESLNIRATL